MEGGEIIMGESLRSHSQWPDCLAMVKQLWLARRVCVCVQFDPICEMLDAWGRPADKRFTHCDWWHQYLSSLSIGPTIWKRKDLTEGSFGPRTPFSLLSFHLPSVVRMLFLNISHFLNIYWLSTFFERNVKHQCHWFQQCDGITWHFPLPLAEAKENNIFF